MNKQAKELAEEIKGLIDQLMGMVDDGQKGPGTADPRKVSTRSKGASGALSMLIRDGFFDKPKDIATVIARMEEIGRYYPNATVGMNLLNLTRRRILNRLEDKKTKNWQYVIRK